MALVEFRDGEREIPDYLADLLSPYADRLFTMTYEQAISLANSEMTSTFLNKKQDEIINQHFRSLRNR